MLGRLLRALEETHQGDLEPRRATAMATLARSIAAIFEEAELAARVEDLEKRLEERR